MININGVTKRFDNGVTALDNVTCSIEKGSIYGLVGSNGSGKSTLLRLLSGIYRQDSGELLIDGQTVYENPQVKQKTMFVPDEPYFFAGGSLNDMIAFYRACYPSFDVQLCGKLIAHFNLDPKKRMSTFSKGMKRQAAVVLAVSCRPDIYFFDETFDGLDPAARNAVKKLIADDVARREATAIISSHNLRELEDICDSLGLLHKGWLIFQNDIDRIRTSLYKIQAAFSGDIGRHSFEGLDIVSFFKRGSLVVLIGRGDVNEALSVVKSKNPAFIDVLPLNLEEIFIHELEGRGYEFKDILI